MVTVATPSPIAGPSRPIASQARAGEPVITKLTQQQNPASARPACPASTAGGTSSDRSRARRGPPAAIHLLSIQAPSASVASQLASAAKARNRPLASAGAAGTAATTASMPLGLAPVAVRRPFIMIARMVLALPSPGIIATFPAHHKPAVPGVLGAQASE
jgi:hypothetical protein